jgi:ribose transport system permease protein
MGNREESMDMGLPEAPGTLYRRIISQVKQLPPGLWMLLLLITVFSLQEPNYLAVNNLRNVLVQSVALMLLAYGQTLVILTEGVDLSLGATVGLVTVCWITLATFGLNIYVAAVLALGVAVLFGVLNGILVSVGKVPSFIATFGTANIAMSCALVMTAGASIYFYHPIFEAVVETQIMYIPLPVIVAAALFGVTWILLYRTRFGAVVFGLGGNREALNFAGVNITWGYIKVYAYAGFLAGVCGLLTTCRVESGQPVVGQGWEFESIAAVILGGTSFREGRGGLNGTIIGVLLLIILRNGLNVTGVSAMHQNAIIGGIVMLAIVVDALVRRGRA